MKIAVDIRFEIDNISQEDINSDRFNGDIISFVENYIEENGTGELLDVGYTLLNAKIVKYPKQKNKPKLNFEWNDAINNIYGGK